MLRKIVIVAALFSLILSIVACTGPTSITAPTPTPTPEPTSAPAAFQIAGLAINPAEVDTGEKVSITVKVTNTGDTGGIYPAKLEVNNIAEVLKNVTVSAGETQTLSFLMSKDIAGTYEVTLGELTGQFVVTDTIPSCCR